MQGMQGKMTYLTYTMTQYNSILKQGWEDVIWRTNGAQVQ